MPEGDTIFRSAASLRTWMGGRTVTAARCSVPGVDARPLVGRVVSSVTPVGKHLLMQFDDPEQLLAPLLLRTHMRMTGSWHVYPAGVTWQRPARQARVVIEAGERLAVCFNVPIVELTTETADTARGVSHLGPDILDPQFDAHRVAQRVMAEPPERAMGEVLLDQRLVAGIGNIYRCESLFGERINPWTTRSDVDIAAVTALLARAAKLMGQNLDPSRISRNLDAGSGTWVYRRSGLPCRVCGTAILSRPQGEQGRVAYWCPRCQPLTDGVRTLGTLSS